MMKPPTGDVPLTQTSGRATWRENQDDLFYTSCCLSSICSAQSKLVGVTLATDNVADCVIHPLSVLARRVCCTVGTPKHLFVHFTATQELR